MSTKNKWSTQVKCMCYNVFSCLLCGAEKGSKLSKRGICPSVWSSTKISEFLPPIWVMPLPALPNLIWWLGPSLQRSVGTAFPLQPCSISCKPWFCQWRLAASSQQAFWKVFFQQPTGLELGRKQITVLVFSPSAEYKYHLGLFTLLHKELFCLVWCALVFYTVAVASLIRVNRHLDQIFKSI